MPDYSEIICFWTGIQPSGKQDFFFVSRTLNEEVYSWCSFETDFEISMVQGALLNLSRGFKPNLNSRIRIASHNILRQICQLFEFGRFIKLKILKEILQCGLNQFKNIGGDIWILAYKYVADIGNWMNYHLEFSKCASRCLCDVSIFIR